jgi:ferritin-like metal-binding protein YciE
LEINLSVFFSLSSQGQSSSVNTGRPNLEQELNMPLDSLRDLYIDKLKDLYSAENQIIKALPGMIKGSSSTELQQALRDHLRVTEAQAKRLEKLATAAGKSAKGKKCVGMEGLLEEGKELLKEESDPQVLDAGLIGSAQAVEHYEIAGYGTAAAWAKMLGDPRSAEVLIQSMNEEKQADELLSTLAENMINQVAASQPEASSNGKRKKK